MDDIEKLRKNLSRRMRATIEAECSLAWGRAWLQFTDGDALDSERGRKALEVIALVAINESRDIAKNAIEALTKERAVAKEQRKALAAVRKELAEFRACRNCRVHKHDPIYEED